MTVARLRLPLVVGMLLLSGFSSPLTAETESLSAGEPETVNDYLTRGRDLLAAGQAETALALLHRAAELFPGNSSVYYYLASAQWKAGDREASLRSTLRRKELTGENRLARFRDENGDDLLTTADEVIARHIEVIGGRDALAAIKTLVVDFTANSTEGSIATIRRRYKRPGYYRQEVLGGSRYTVTDGRTVWRVADGDWQEVHDPGYQRLSSIDDWFIDFEERNIRHEFIGLEIFSDTPVYHLVRTFWDGFRQDLFFSAGTGFLTEIRSEYPEGNPVMISTMSLWDYRDVGGIRMPHVFIATSGRWARRTAVS